MLCLCPICSHPRRQEIEQELGRCAPLPKIAAQFKVMRAELVRHHSICLAPGPPLIAAVEDMPPGPDRVEQTLRRAHASTTWALRAAYTAEDRKGILHAAAQDARHAALEAGLIPILREARRAEPESGLSPQDWISLRDVLIAALRPFPDALAAVSKAIVEAREAQRIEEEARELHSKENIQ